MVQVQQILTSSRMLQGQLQINFTVYVQVKAKVSYKLVLQNNIFRIISFKT